MLCLDLVCFYVFGPSCPILHFRASVLEIVNFFCALDYLKYRGKSVMHTTFLLLALAGTFHTSFAAPAMALEPRVANQCGQYQSQTAGSYTLATNGWGWSYGTGSQCSQIDSVSGNTIAWSTTWQWANVSSGYGQYNVKSFTNLQAAMTNKPLNQYTSMLTNWAW